MKARVLRAFRDKVTKERRKVGDEIEVTKKRFTEINSTQHGAFLAELIKPAPQTPNENGGDTTPDQ